MSEYKFQEIESKWQNHWSDNNSIKCDINSVEKNFYNLCRANFETSENPKSGRGGSYGVGKSILWTSSIISTVLFSSEISKGMKYSLSFLLQLHPSPRLSATSFTPFFLLSLIHI